MQRDNVQTDAGIKPVVYCTNEDCQQYGIKRLTPMLDLGPIVEGQE
ncbi:MAG: hypothetical protein KJO69_07750 [Gammaproteobacteria bacterium]|nr:hypothetical protein [Gammaproteobacteria bacterium]